MRVIDTNVLLYSINEDSQYQDPCLRFLEELRNDPSPSFLTWSICYEFLRVSTPQECSDRHEVLTRLGAFSKDC